MQYHKPHVFSFKSHVEYGILAARSLCDDHRNVSGFRRKLCPLPCWSAQKRNENFLLEERITFLIRTYNYICQTRSFLSFPTSIHSNFTNWSPRIMGSSLFHTLSRPQILAVIYSVSSIKSHNDALKSNHSSAHNSLMVSCLTQNKSQKAANGPPGLASTFPSPSATTPGGCSLPCSCTALLAVPELNMLVPQGLCTSDSLCLESSVLNISMTCSIPPSSPNSLLCNFIELVNKIWCTFISKSLRHCRWRVK